MSNNSELVMDWIDRMAQKHGDRVYGYGRSWDWGQALCVEQYGPDPANWPDAPTDDDVLKARDWENGEWPEWVER